ncbi:Inner membrane protein YhaI [Flavobacterium sp. ACN2]|nr:Inner membrane protein YhaI [Flavobacterium sp. ACN2]
MFQNYSNFSGRARRSEYWYFRLATAVIFFVFIALAIIVSVIGGGFLGFPVAIGLIALYSLIALIPSLAVTVRRMHDLGKSGWNVLISFIPLVGPIWFLVLLATEGEHGENYYGPDPKSTIEEIDEIGINN